MNFAMETGVFNRIFVESRVKDNRYTNRILSHFPKHEVLWIENISDVFERVKKPYLKKRKQLDLFIGKKEGQLLRKTVDAYGLGRGQHYYFIHSYNCIYECEYCYLQGYFNSPDIVLFVNHDEVIEQMEGLLKLHKDEEVWFHGGEFSDSLAMSHYAKEWGEYFDFFERHPSAKLELRTKSVNIRIIEELKPLSNVYVTFSLSPESVSENVDLKTPGLKMRLKAMTQLAKAGFQLGVHLDPIIDIPNILEEYTQLLNNLFDCVPMEKVGYISVGVVRFSKKSFRAMSENYPNSLILNKKFTNKDNEKISYEEYRKNWILRNIIDMMIEKGYNKALIYKCMEENE